MAREGTRSATGNSRPRVFQTVDTAPTIKRTTKPKAAKKTTAEPVVKPVKPAGVTKKKAVAKKDGAAAKVNAPARKSSTAKAKKAVTKPKAIPAE
ncbi:hypothetical protein F4861DRAFT_302241 [Xylaria intraflava]|nr:hypothetical protein F4861DRAFT_302241 [Xylaria intraflava]